MAVLVGTHVLVFGSLLKDLAQVRHELGGDVGFQGDDDALLGILQNISVADTSGRNELRQSLDVRHLERDLVAPLVALDRFPVDVDVGRLFETLVDGTVVGIGLGVGRESGQTGDLSLLRQGEGIAAFGHFHGSGSRAAAGLAGAAAAGQKSSRHDESQDHCYDFAKLHVVSPFHFVLFSVFTREHTQPLTAPAMMPLSKYFWKKGYMIIRGREEMMMVAYFSSSAS